MSCNNYFFVNLSTVITASCAENSYFQVVGCHFISLNGVSVSITCSSTLNKVLISSSNFAFCQGSALSISGKYDGIVEKCCFYCVVAGSGSVIQSTATAPSSISFLMSSNAFCPNQYQGSYVFYLHYINIEIFNTNSTYSLVSAHTMFEFYGSNFLLKYDSVSHNGMGCVFRIGGTGDGGGNYTNHVNNTVVGSDWGFFHDYLSSPILFYSSLYLNNAHASFAYYGKSFYYDSVVFGCKFANNNVANTPLEIKNAHLNAGLCVGKYSINLETKSKHAVVLIPIMIFQFFILNN